MRVSWLVGTFCLLLIGAGCLQSAATTSSALPTTDVVPEGDSKVAMPDVHPDETRKKEVVDSDVQADASTSAPAIATDPTLAFKGVTLDMEAGNYFFSPATIKAQVGDPITITFTKSSGAHTFVIDEIGLEENIAVGSTINFKAPSVPGRYPYYCNIGPHRTLGMEGVLVVE